MNIASGYKTYIVAAIGILVGLDQGLIQAGYHIPAIPGWILTLLGFAGLYSLRSGIATDTAKAIATVAATLPPPSPITVVTPAVTLTAQDTAAMPDLVGIIKAPTPKGPAMPGKFVG